MSYATCHTPSFERPRQAHNGATSHGNSLPFAWQIQVHDWKRDLGLVGALEDLKPWSGLEKKFTGISMTPRIESILNLATVEILGGANETMKILGTPNAKKVLEERMCNIFCDISQNPERRAFSSAEGVGKCLHTASVLYSYKADRVVLPFEKLIFMGHHQDLILPPSMSEKECNDLAGQGISLPSLGLVFLSLWCTTGFGQ